MKWPRTDAQRRRAVTRYLNNVIGVLVVARYIKRGAVVVDGDTVRFGMEPFPKHRRIAIKVARAASAFPRALGFDFDEGQQP